MNATPVLAGFLGTPELIVLLCLALLFFGASRLPGIARSLGRSVNEFKSGMKEDPDAAKNPTNAPADTGAGSQKN
jgi:sec-independent protein translocase protein TatA